MNDTQTKSLLRRQESTRQQAESHSPRARWTPAFAGVTVLMLFLSITSVFSDGLNEVHPGFDMVNLQPNGQTWRVAGIDFLSDGRMVLGTWGNPGDVYLLSGVQNGTASSITYTHYAMGTNQSLGLRVVNDKVYLSSFPEVTELVDVDNDGRADQYNNINDNFPVSESLLGYVLDIVYLYGKFHIGLGSDVGFGGPPFDPSAPGRAQWMELNWDGTSAPFAAGTRNPNGMGLAYGNKIFATDNQGNYMPSSKLVHVQKGKFYGFKANPANTYQNQEESPPLSWLPHGTVSRSPGNVFGISEGKYAGQLMVTEESNNLGQEGRIYRVSVEDMNGTLQGAVIPFTARFNGGVNRVAMDDQGNIYAGILGATMTWNTIPPIKGGLYRLSPNGTDVFEILAVRTLNTNQIELEFTKPVESSANQTGRYTVRTWTFEPSFNYGAGNNIDNHGLNVTSAQVSADRLKVVLTINNMQLGYLIHIDLANNFQSQSGESIWTGETWLTLNSYGPGIIPQTAGCKNAAYHEYDASASVEDAAMCVTVDVKSHPSSKLPFNVRRLSQGQFQVNVPLSENYELIVTDVLGKTIHRIWGNKPGFVSLDMINNSSGVYFVHVRSLSQALTTRFVN